MLRSLYAGISGMKANQVKLDVIGNNIANVGTTSFKGSRVRFQDMVSQSMSQALAPGASQGGINPRQVGLGVQVAGIDTLVGQGGMQPTSRNLDVAMDGEGYLMVAKGKTPLTNADGVGVDPTEHTANAPSGTDLFYTRDGALTLDKEGNLLNSDGLRVLGYAISEVDDKPSLDYDVTKSTTTPPKSPTLNYVNADSTTLKPSGTLIPLVIPEKIFVLGDANAVPPTSDGDVRVKTFSIEKDGVVKAILEGGKVAILGQIAVASFKNPGGLSKVGGNIYQNTSNSGAPIVRTGKNTDKAVPDNSAGYGDMLQGMLEMSNVDLAEQFTDMIIASRAFQAAGKTISTGDEILQDIINLKR
ncbi:flagellar hook-basal body complex protein [Clostridium estertheticum]|uniref:flagellar hook-basal body complex protein n=1 Tax=Clostridium estertheticum TaxID=238834 RepID=UPI0013E9324A|nr:flagellar hook-basal body complex protein [Clostridium estertheticum]MBN4049317.1 flagellar hook-basal body complex protein [bacterium AH-315-N14]MBZ9688074.1 flagellar hook-basal body complex protein [Clostridium estertheticum]